MSTEEDLIPEEAIGGGGAARAPSRPPCGSVVHHFYSSTPFGSDERSVGLLCDAIGPGFGAFDAVLTGYCYPSRRSPARWLR